MSEIIDEIVERLVSAQKQNEMLSDFNKQVLVLFEDVMETVTDLTNRVNQLETKLKKPE